MAVFDFDYPSASRRTSAAALPHGHHFLPSVTVLGKRLRRHIHHRKSGYLRQLLLLLLYVNGACDCGETWSSLFVSMSWCNETMKGLESRMMAMLSFCHNIIRFRLSCRREFWVSRQILNEKRIANTIRQREIVLDELFQYRIKIAVLEYLSHVELLPASRVSQLESIWIGNRCRDDVCEGQSKSSHQPCFLQFPFLLTNFWFRRKNGRHHGGIIDRNGRSFVV